VNRKFNYHSLEELQTEVRRDNIELDFSENTDVLNRNLMINNHRIPNRLAIQPMEGCDSDEQGNPGKLTFRRYKRFAEGGAGLIWFEATAILSEARSNPHQLLLDDSTEPAFAELLRMTKNRAIQEYGIHHEPFCVLQLNHSGRFSKPEGIRKPLIAVHHSILDKVVNIDENYPLLEDGQLKYIQEKFVKSAKLAYKAGFDAVDIKSCHGYLILELLGAKTRIGEYGGSYQNRTRFLKETIELIKQEVPMLIITTRLNISNVIFVGNSWGISKNNNTGEWEIDLSEPKRLVKELDNLGVSLINATAGVPYFNPYIGRPYDQPVEGGCKEPESPLKGVERLFKFARQIQEMVPDLPIMGTGYSWLRQFGGAAAAANVGKGHHSLAGFGRQAFAYPNFARNLLEKGQMEDKKCCITCSKCSQLMICQSKTGCVVRDADLYANVYKEVLAVSKNK